MKNIILKTTNILTRQMLHMLLIHSFLISQSIDSTEAFFSRKTKPITSPCNVIENFEISHKLKQIGDKQWQNICPKDRYVTAAWSPNPYEPFYKAKCCGKGVDSTLSWEIRDIPFFHQGPTAADKRWNIECDKYSIITGFRFIVDKVNSRILSAVRCSILTNKIVDKDNCTVLTFDNQSDVSLTKYNKDWNHECPAGYGMVAVYDKTNFKKIEKAKCCRVIDDVMKVNWTTNFGHNLGGFEQSQNDDLDFRLMDGRYLFINHNASGYTDVKFGRIISPGLSNIAMCLELHLIQLGSSNMMKISIKDESHTQLLKTLKIFKTSQTEVFQIFVKASSTSQLYFDMHLFKGSFNITKLNVVNETLCRVDRCDNNPKYGCLENEDCVPHPPYGKLNCKCPEIKGYIKTNDVCHLNPNYRTTIKPLTTKGKGKGPIEIDGTTKGPKTTKSTPFSTKSTPFVVTQTVKTDEDGITGEKVSNPKQQVEGYVYAIIGGLVVIILVVIGIAAFLCYRKAPLVKNQRPEHEMSTLHHAIDHKYSLDSVASSAPFYVPYMPELGVVERVESRRSRSTFSHPRAASILSAALPGGRCWIDATTGEPLYTRIDRSVSAIEQSNEIDELTLSTSPPNVHYTYIYKGQEKFKSEEEEEDDDILSLRESSRRPSCMTLLRPEYGESDSEFEEEPAFFIPPDDEEDLLDNLHELTPESVEISKKILGQGAFGLVKLGTYISVHGTREVAVKSLKLPSNQELTQEERINFFQEASLMSQFEHPNVITLFGVLVGKKPCMVLEFLERGNLWKYLTRVKRIRTKENLKVILFELHCLFLNMARDIASGMSYLAGLKFVHRDLAARNVLLSKDLHCKIADFGLSRHFLKDEHYYTSHGGQIPVKWTAPEALQFKKYSTQSDVWSYGIVLWEIWSIGERPYNSWNNDKVLKEVTEKAYRLPAPDGVPRLIYKLMIDCWHPDKDQRPNFSKIKYCLDHKDERILGKNKTPVHRTRSITFTNNDPDLQSISSTFSDLQNVYCKTE